MDTNVQHLEELESSRDFEKQKLGRYTGKFSGVAGSLRGIDARCVSLLEPESYESGRYQQLCSTLPLKKPDGEGVVIAVTSPSAGDGKTLTTINLAGACAHNEQLRVLVVDVDLRRKHESMRQYLSFPKEMQSGLTDILHKPGIKRHAAFYIDKHPNLSILPRGKRNTNPYGLLESARFGQFIEVVRKYYHYVILDTPPVLPVPDNSAISKWVDGFLMVVTANRTPRGAVEEAMRSIGEAKTLGLVLNRCEPLAKRYYRYYGMYGDE